MEFSSEWLGSLTEDELLNTYEWCRVNARAARAHHAYSLAAWWEKCGSHALHLAIRQGTEALFRHQGRLDVQLTIDALEHSSSPDDEPGA